MKIVLVLLPMVLRFPQENNLGRKIRNTTNSGNPAYFCYWARYRRIPVEVPYSRTHILKECLEHDRVSS